MTKTYKQIKYKSLLRLRDVFYPKKRILNLKRPKWASLKKTFFFKFFKRSNINRAKQKKKIIFQNQFIHFAPLKWYYLKSSFRNSLLAKLRLVYFFNLKFPAKGLKKYYLTGNILTQLESRLDILLWRAGFFESPAVARFFINHKNIYINDVLLNLSNHIVKEGDIISVKNSAKTHIINSFLSKKINRSKKNRLFFEKLKMLYFTAPYLEINTHTLEFIYLAQYNKNFKSSFLYNASFNFSALNSYFRYL